MDSNVRIKFEYGEPDYDYLVVFSECSDRSKKLRFGFCPGTELKINEWTTQSLADRIFRAILAGKPIECTRTKKTSSMWDRALEHSSKYRVLRIGCAYYQGEEYDKFVEWVKEWVAL